MKILVLAAIGLSLSAYHASAWTTDTPAGPTSATSTANAAANSTAASTSRSGSRSSSRSAGGAGGAGGNASGGNAIIAGQDISPPSYPAYPPGGGGSDCPVVGPGAGASGGFAGLGLGWSTISPHCDARHLAQFLLSAGDCASAEQVLNKEYSLAVHLCAMPVAAHPDWCLTASAAERAQHRECK